MLGKRISALILLVTLVTGAVALSAAPTYVNTLRLSRDGSFTVLTIEGTGQLRYAHQSVESKDGKPFRIVIDCLASRHGLARKSFTDLPISIVSAIRTSQYAVTPEEVVRVVVDLKEESIYRVEADGNTVNVRISDQKTHPFSRWVNQNQLLQKQVTPKSDKVSPTVALVDKPENKPVVKSTAFQPAAKKTPVDAKAEKDNEPGKFVRLPAPSLDQVYGPILAVNTPTTQQPAAKTEVKKTEVKTTPKTTVTNKPVETKQPVVAKAKTETPAQPKTVAKTPAVKKTAPTVAQKTTPAAQPKVTKKLANDSIQKAQFFASIDADAQKTPEPGMNTKKTEKPAPPTKSKSKDAPATSPNSTGTKAAAEQKAPSPVKEANDGQLASVDPSMDQKANEIMTSKYRRMTAKEAEMKASEVVQFPKRMVIKYKRTNPRDPFESLIVAEADRKSNANLNVVPNIETLHLVGILKPESGKGAALLEDRDGIGYILRPGDRVRNGYVAQVDDYAVYFQINEYGWGRTIMKKMEKEK